MSYQSDRSWSDQFLPQVRAIVGPHLLVPAPFELDAKEATDLMVLRARDMTIAVRLRRPGYADKYRYQFTIRSKRDSGSKTEMAKLLEGWGDWMLYGHVDDAGSISTWWLIDLHLWRARLLREGYARPWRTLAIEQSNTDKQTHFMAFDLRVFGRQSLSQDRTNCDLFPTSGRHKAYVAA